MKFKTKEELTKWLADNISTDEGGEFYLKPLDEVETNYEAAKRGNAATIKDSKKFEERAKKAETDLQTFKADLERVNTELTGLKAITGGDAQKALQDLNKEKSDLTMKLNAILAENNDLQKKVAGISELEQRANELQGTINRNKILSEMRTAAGKLKIPNTVIDTDLELYVDRFDIDDTGKVFSKGDVPKTVDNALAEFQKARPHWIEPSQGTGAKSAGQTGTGGGKTLADIFKIA
jgi:chromosome segregation ATPase